MVESDVDGIVGMQIGYSFPTLASDNYGIDLQSVFFRTSVGVK